MELFSLIIHIFGLQFVASRSAVNESRCYLRWESDLRSDKLFKNNPFSNCTIARSIKFINTDLTNDEIIKLLENITKLESSEPSRTVNITFSKNRNLGGKIFSVLFKNMTLSNSSKLKLDIFDADNHCMNLPKMNSNASVKGVSPLICNVAPEFTRNRVYNLGNQVRKLESLFLGIVGPFGTRRFFTNVQEIGTLTKKSSPVFTISKTNFECYRSFPNLKKLIIHKPEDIKLEAKEHCCMDKEDLAKINEVVQFPNGTDFKLTQKCGWSKSAKTDFSREVHHGPLQIDSSDNLTQLALLRSILDGNLILSSKLKSKNLAFLAFLREIRCNDKNIAAVEIGNLGLEEFDLPSLTLIRNCSMRFQYTGSFYKGSETFSVDTGFMDEKQRFYHFDSFQLVPKTCLSNDTMWKSMRSISLRFRSCTTILGDVVIDGLSLSLDNSMVKVLTEMMRTVRVIEGRLIVRNLKVTKFPSFQTLKEVHAGDVDVAVQVLNNPHLRSLSMFLPVITARNQSAILLLFKNNPKLCREKSRAFLFGKRFVSIDSGKHSCSSDNDVFDGDYETIALIIYYGCVAFSFVILSITFFSFGPSNLED